MLSIIIIVSININTTVFGQTISNNNILIHYVQTLFNNLQTKIQDYLQMSASKTVINNKFISDSGKNELNYNYKQHKYSCINSTSTSSSKTLHLLKA